MRGLRRAFSSSFPLLPEGGVMPDGKARLVAVPVLRRSLLRRFLETDSTNRGKEAPVFGSRNPLFCDPLYPTRQAFESFLAICAASSPVSVHLPTAVFLPFIA